MIDTKASHLDTAWLKNSYPSSHWNVQFLKLYSLIQQVGSMIFCNGDENGKQKGPRNR